MKKQILRIISALAVPFAFGITAFADDTPQATQTTTAQQTTPQQTGKIVSADQSDTQSNNQSGSNSQQNTVVNTQNQQATQTSDNPATGIKAPSVASAIAIAAITGLGSAILLTTAKEHQS